MTSNEKSKKIRAALKAAGISNRQVSVRHHYAGYSSAWDITIKDKSLSIKEISDICKRFENIDYDERTGEILSGANDFVHVDRAYDYPVDCSPYLAQVEQVISQLRRSGQSANIGDSGWIIFFEIGYYVCVNKKYESIDYWLSKFTMNLHEGVSESIARKMKEADLDASYLARKRSESN